MNTENASFRYLIKINGMGSSEYTSLSFKESKADIPGMEVINDLIGEQVSFELLGRIDEMNDVYMVYEKEQEFSPKPISFISLDGKKEIRGSVMIVLVDHDGNIADMFDGAEEPMRTILETKYKEI